MTTTCSKTGLSFEAKSKNQKNHPAISKILTDAAKSPVYQHVLKSCEIVKEQNMKEDDAIIFLKNILNAASEEAINKFWQDASSCKELAKLNTEIRNEQIGKNQFTEEEMLDISSRNWKPSHDIDKLAESEL